MSVVAGKDWPLKIEHVMSLQTQEVNFRERHRVHPKLIQPVYPRKLFRQTVSVNTQHGYLQETSKTKQYLVLCPHHSTGSADFSKTRSLCNKRMANKKSSLIHAGQAGAHIFSSTSEACCAAALKWCTCFDDEGCSPEAGKCS